MNRNTPGSGPTSEGADACSASGTGRGSALRAGMRLALARKAALVFAALACFAACASAPALPELPVPAGWKRLPVGQVATFLAPADLAPRDAGLPIDTVRAAYTSPQFEIRFSYGRYDSPDLSGALRVKAAQISGQPARLAYYETRVAPQAPVQRIVQAYLERPIPSWGTWWAVLTVELREGALESDARRIATSLQLLPS